MMKPTFFAKAKGKSAGEIYIYQDIGDGWFGGITAQSFADALKELGAVDTLDIYVNSPGGSVFDGVAIYNQLKRVKAQKTVHIDGIAASIASIICMAGDKIVCASNAMMMIHDPWGMCVGTAEDMRANAATLDQIRDTLLDTYVARTKGDKAKISQMMSDETWMKAEDAKAQGFVDEIESDAMEPADMAFALLNKFKNAPENLRAEASKTSAAIARMGMKVLKNTSRQVAA
jgi:ATP-dependent Clp protease protease subunit